MLHDTLGKVLLLHKDSNTDIRKHHLKVEGLKKEGLYSVNAILKEVNSIKSGASFAHIKLVVTVHTSYSNFSKNVEHSYSIFYSNVLSTLKYFLDGNR